MNMSVVKFDLLAASDADWDAYFRHKDEILREADPEEPLLPREKRKAVFISSAASPYRQARMLLYIRKEYPGVKYVATGNADSNAPMLAINNRLGFKKHLAIKLYKLKLGPKLPPEVGQP